MSAEDRPDTDNTKEVTCPYCGHEFSDSWEFGAEESEQEVDCDTCKKTFTMNVNVRISYSTRRIDCEDIAEDHVWGEPKAYHYDADWIAKKHAENPRLHKAEDKPHTLWFRDCENCDESDMQDLGLNAPCPWPEAVK